MMQEITQEQARAALYFDFEGTKTDPVSLVGYGWHGPAGGPILHQLIIEPGLHGAVDPSDPDVDTAASLDAAVQSMLDVARTGSRLMVSWSAREMDVIREEAERRTIKGVESAWINAIPLARRWLRRFHPTVDWPRDPQFGKHQLRRYLNLVGYEVPRIHAARVTGERIRYLRQQLLRRGDYESITPVAKRKWKNLLAHNRHDVLGLMDLVLRITHDLEDN